MVESRKRRILLFVIVVVPTVLYSLYKNSSLHGKQLLQIFFPEVVNCSAYGFGNLSTSKISIYDFFIFDHELDMLEIRLHELYDHVTLFLIAESDRTFSGKSKPLYLKENWSRFAKYHDKIRRAEINLTDPQSNITNSWAKEAKLRDDGIRLALPTASGDFILLTSDVDKIPKARFVLALATCNLPTPFPPLLLQCDFYYYSYEFRNAANSSWSGSTVSRFGINETVPSNLRSMRQSFRPLSGTCFHCSYCFDSISAVREKLSSFSHTEVDVERYRNQQHIIDRFQNGTDLFDRPDQPLRRVKANEMTCRSS